MHNIKSMNFKRSVMAAQIELKFGTDGASS